MFINVKIKNFLSIKDEEVNKVPKRIVQKKKEDFKIVFSECRQTPRLRLPKMLCKW